MEKDTKCHCYRGLCGSCMAIEGKAHPCHNCGGSGVIPKGEDFEGSPDMEFIAE